MSRKFLKSVALTLCLSVAVPLFNTINAFAATQPSIMGESAITMDLDTGEIIYSKNADEKRSPASTTKLLHHYYLQKIKVNLIQFLIVLTQLL